MPSFTLPRQLRKKYRKIVVNETMYAWKIYESLYGGHVSGFKILHVNSKTSILGTIEHRANFLTIFDSNGKKAGKRVLTEKVIITPAYIRAVILYAITDGWNYNKDFTIDVHNDIPLNDHIEFTFPILNDRNIVVIAFERNEDQTLKVLNKDLNEFKGKKSFYNVFTNQEEAEKYMISKNSINLNLELWMTDNEDNALAKVESGKIEYFNPSKKP